MSYEITLARDTFLPGDILMFDEDRADYIVLYYDAVTPGIVIKSISEKGTQFTQSLSRQTLDALEFTHLTPLNDPEYFL